MISSISISEGSSISAHPLWTRPTPYELGPHPMNSAYTLWTWPTPYELCPHPMNLAHHCATVAFCGILGLCGILCHCDVGILWHCGILCHCGILWHWVIPERIRTSPTEEIENDTPLPSDIPGQPNLPPLPGHQSPKWYPPRTSVILSGLINRTSWTSISSRWQALVLQLRNTFSQLIVATW